MNNNTLSGQEELHHVSCLACLTCKVFFKNKLFVCGEVCLCVVCVCVCTLWVYMTCVCVIVIRAPARSTPSSDFSPTERKKIHFFKKNPIQGECYRVGDFLFCAYCSSSFATHYDDGLKEMVTEVDGGFRYSKPKAQVFFLFLLLFLLFIWQESLGKQNGNETNNQHSKIITVPCDTPKKNLILKNKNKKRRHRQLMIHAQISRLEKAQFPKIQTRARTCISDPYRFVFHFFFIKNKNSRTKKRAKEQTGSVCFLFSSSLSFWNKKNEKKTERITNWWSTLKFQDPTRKRHNSRRERREREMAESPTDTHASRRCTPIIERIPSC